MPQTPGPENTARYILSVYIEHNMRAGHALNARNFILPFNERGWQQSDFPAGMEYAIAQDWIEAKGRDNFVLTESGYDEAIADTAGFL